MRKTIGTPIVLLAIVVLAACGGGGESETLPPAATQPAPTTPTQPGPTTPNPAPDPTSPPLVQSDPQPQSVVSGAAASFTVSSANASAYRWQTSIDDGATWSDIPQAIAATLTLPRVTMSDTATRYRVILTNANGTTVSEAARLDVTPRLRLLAGALGGYGFRDGPAAESRLNFPRGVVTGADGSVYVADGINHVIRVFHSDGTLNTVAGVPGLRGRVDGPSATAKFSNPRSIAVDRAGSLWVIDQDTCWLRKIAGGQVISVADLGGGNCLATSTTGATYNPSEVAIGPSGDVFVSDENRHVIRRIEASGAVTVYAGSEAEAGTDDGARLSARLQSPRGLAFDSAGNLYVADRGNGTIRRIAGDGTVTTFAGTPGAQGHADGVGTSARFNRPHALAVQGAALWVTDTTSHVLRRIDLSSAAVETVAGSPGNAGLLDGRGANALLNWPAGIAVERSGSLVIGDAGNNMLRRVSTAGEVVRIAGQPNPAGESDGVGAAARFTWTNSLAADATGNVYAMETQGTTVRKIALDGTVSTLAGKANEAGVVDGIGTMARFSHQGTIATGSDGSIYVAHFSTSPEACLVRKIFPSGLTMTVAGRLGFFGCAPRDGDISVAVLDYPSGIAVSTTGVIAVTEGTISCAIRQISGNTVSTLVERNKCEVRDGARGVARVASPVAPAYDAAGAIVFADARATARTLVRKLNPDGSIETIAGSLETGNADGVGPAARFESITAIAIDSKGRIFVLDSGNHAVRMIDQNRRVRTLIGWETGPRVVLGEAGSLNYPEGLALLPNGGLAISSEFAVLTD